MVPTEGAVVTMRKDVSVTIYSSSLGVSGAHAQWRESEARPSEAPDPHGPLLSPFPYPSQASRLSPVLSGATAVGAWVGHKDTWARWAAREAG